MFESELGVLVDTPFFEELRAIGGGLFFFPGLLVADGADLVAAGSEGGGETTCEPGSWKLHFFRRRVAMLFTEANDLTVLSAAPPSQSTMGVKENKPA
jgi:hypothetical protein